MASLIFLIIHPIWYPIYCGGKGKAMKPFGKGNGAFCSQLLVAGY
jgi:hypothetical protein